MTCRPYVWLAACVLAASCGTPSQQEQGAQDVALKEEAARRYRSMVEDLAAKGALDTDVTLERKLQRIVLGLGRANEQLRPADGSIAWEVHVAEDSHLDAIAMPGAKLLVGAPFVRHFTLTEGELATLVGHEMGHVIAGHRAIQVVAGFESGLSDELRAAERMRANELEADAIGIELALCAGWSAPEVLSFYEKLAATASVATFSSTHPTASGRLERAQALVDAWVHRGPELRSERVPRS